MNPIIQQLVNTRINQVTGSELYQYAKQYGVSVKPEQAEAIAKRVRGKNINIFDDGERKKALTILSQELGPELTSKLNQLFEQLVLKR